MGNNLQRIAVHLQPPSLHEPLPEKKTNFNIMGLPTIRKPKFLISWERCRATLGILSETQTHRETDTDGSTQRLTKMISNRKTIVSCNLVVEKKSKPIVFCICPLSVTNWRPILLGNLGSENPFQNCDACVV